jgi:hypothetical protein
MPKAAVTNPKGLGLFMVNLINYDLLSLFLFIKGVSKKIIKHTLKVRWCHIQITQSIILISMRKNLDSIYSIDQIIDNKDK